MMVMIAIEQDLSFLSSRLDCFTNLRTLCGLPWGGQLSASFYFDQLSLALLGSLAKLA